MTTSLLAALPTTPPAAPPAFAALVQAIRPELHRYWARMVGSVVDAEAVVQAARAQADAALPTTPVATMRGGLFRIAPNNARDHRRCARQQPVAYRDEPALVADLGPQLEEPELGAVARSVFLQLASKPRSCGILKDVMGGALAEISELRDATIPEIKAALHRGRVRLRELAKRIDADAAAPLDPPEQALLRRAMAHFNAHDFDSVRALRAEEVRLDLVNRLKRRGRVAVGASIFTATNNWRPFIWPWAPWSNAPRSWSTGPTNRWPRPTISG